MEDSKYIFCSFCEVSTRYNKQLYFYCDIIYKCCDSEYGIFQAISEHMTRDCKCHGLSGTCALKTCWRRMPTFREVGNRLKDKFDGASKVTISNDGRSLVTEDDTIKPPSKEDLLYTENSPNFCKPRKKYGSLGTQGRLCNPESMGIDGCTLMCCGRDYKQTEVTIQENCKCQFIWCCQVICKTCTSIKTISRCE